MSQPHPDPYVGEFDPKLGRVRTHSDDFFDHRKEVLRRIQESLKLEKASKRRPRR